MNYTYDGFAEQVKEFNRIAGKDGVPSKQDLLNQLKIIMEEVKETIDDLEKEDKVGILDGYTDMMVTVVGFGQMLEKLNVPIHAALYATAENNLTKFPRYNEDIVIETFNQYMQKHNTVSCSNFEGRCVFKNEHDKVLKPAGYVTNDLSTFIPSTWRLE